MRILHVRSSCGMYGAEGVILALARESRRAGHVPIIAPLRDRRHPSYVLQDLASAEHLETLMIDVAGRADALAVLRMATLIRRLRCDVVHAHDYKTTVMGLAAAALVRVPLVATLHGDTRETQPVRF
jgi:hypothetical protein